MPSVDVVTSQISYGETGVARTLFLSCPGGVVGGKEISQASSHIIEAQGKKKVDVWVLKFSSNGRGGFNTFLF